ncbi:hypothetical protein HDU78_003085 [Chytriomyces hyalinus]|nr:hypothetical protein HDU78_003085 [Chytriomyces hyalinus]
MTPPPHQLLETRSIAIIDQTNASEPVVFYVADPSVSGTLSLTFVCAIVILGCFALHEVLRRQKPFFKLFYTRLEACRKEAPDMPTTFFGWITASITTPESFVVEKVGLDAAMFLRFLKMSFLQFLLLTIAVTPALTCINYYATIPTTSPPTNSTLIVTQHLGLATFSISNVTDGSSWLIAHTLFTLLVTFTTYYTLYKGFKEFATLSSTYLREDNNHGSNADRPAWRANEALQLRTVLVQNIPPNLRSGAKLSAWFEDLGVGEVEVALLDKSVSSSIFMDIPQTNGHGSTGTATAAAAAGTGHSPGKKRNIQVVLSKLLEERAAALQGLERSFLLWSRNIAEAKKKLERRRPFTLKWEIPLSGEVSSSSQAAFNKRESMVDIVSAHLSEDEVQKLRPKLGWLKRPREFREASTVSKSAASHDDAIEYYTNHLNKLTAMVKLERLKALDPDLLLKHNNILQKNGSAFVTFKTQRSAQIAVQVLLFSSFNRYKMQISLAPAPQDVIWPTISMHPIRRHIQSYLVNIIAIAFTFFWIVPASSVAVLTNLDELAKFQPLSPLISTIARNPSLYVFLKTIGPPIVINIFNMIIPYIFEFIIGLQGLESRSKIETRTLAHYFFFLIFNVLLVFTLSKAVLNYINLVVANPYAVFQILAGTLPTGATFFINYITIDIVFFALELLRPVILIWNAFLKLSNKTPRQLHEMNLMTSYLNFGILYPIHILIFIIALVYSVVAPIILLPATIYFGLGYLVYRNQLLFVYVKEWEAYGRHWTMAFSRIIIGLIIFQITMAGMFLIKGANYCSIVPVLLIPTTVIFHAHCMETFQKRTRIIPLDQLPPPKLLRINISSNSKPNLTLDRDFKLSALLPPSRSPSQRKPKSPTSPNTSGPLNPLNTSDPILITAEMVSSEKSLPNASSQILSSNWMEAGDDAGEEIILEPHVVLSPEESLLERYPVSYLNPVFSKPLPRPWLPLSVAGYWQLLPRYVSEPDLEITPVLASIEPGPSVLQNPFENAEIRIQNDPLISLDRQMQSPTTDATNPMMQEIAKMDVGGSGSFDNLGSRETFTTTSGSNPQLAPNDRVRRLTKTGVRRGSMSKGLMVVGAKGEISSTHEEVHLELDGGKVRKWKGSKDDGLHAVTVLDVKGSEILESKEELP